MKSGSSGLATALLTAQSILAPDCYTFTLSNGTIARYTTLDQDLTLGVNTFSSKGPLFQRGAVKLCVGLQVDTLDLTITPRPTDTISGVAWLQAASLGVLDGCAVLVQRAVIDRNATTANAVSVLGYFQPFSGSLGSLEIDRTQIKATVNSDLYILNQQMPRNVYQGGCMHALYSADCDPTGTLRAAKTVTGTVASGTPTVSTVPVSLAAAAGFYDLGVIKFTSGQNVNVSRTVKVYTSGLVTLVYPLPKAPAVGDSFSITAGCDKQLGTCTAKFANQANFRGMPYIPIPETAA